MSDDNNTHPETTMAPIYPLCGCTLNLDDGRPCPNRSTRVDACGVGFCEDHQHDLMCGQTEPVNDIAEFDPWWMAATNAHEAGDTCWDGLEYGEWPA